MAVNSGEDIIDEVNILVLKVKADLSFFQCNLDPCPETDDVTTNIFSYCLLFQTSVISSLAALIGPLQLFALSFTPCL